MTRRTLFTAAIAALSTLALSAGAFAQAEEHDDPRLDKLRAKFEQRYPEILKAKNAGKIGENTVGHVEIVHDEDKDDADLRKLVAAENADRDDLYRIVAELENVTPEEVAKHNALRNYKKAGPGDYLKKPDGTWGRKKG